MSREDFDEKSRDNAMKKKAEYVEWLRKFCKYDRRHYQHIPSDYEGTPNPRSRYLGVVLS